MAFMEMNIIILTLIKFLIYWIWRKPSGKILPPQIPGSWPVMGHLRLLSGSKPVHKTLGDLADKYGPIFTIKLGVHRALVVSNSEMARECFSSNDKAFASRPKALAMEILGYNYSLPGFSPYGPYWRQVRKIMTLELLSNHRLESFKHVREYEVKKAMSGLYKKWNVVGNCDRSHKVMLELSRLFEEISLNVIYQILVGKRYAEYCTGHSSEDDKDREWRQTMRDFSALSGKFAVSDAIPVLRWLDLGGVEKAMKKNLAELDRVVDGWLAEHKQRTSARGNGAKVDKDFMDIMLSELEDTPQISNRSADTVNKAVCLALLLASSDTTTITLTWTVALLLNNPDVLKKVQQELDTQIGRERQVNDMDTKNLVYLHAVLKESLRLYPAVPLLIPHESIQDCSVGGYHIPAGTRLFVNVHKIHHDPNVWADPDEFRPERFLTTHSDFDVRGQNLELIPFGSGRRSCPGISFALQILGLVLGNLVHGFELETSANSPVDMTEGAGLTMNKATPLEVLISPRLPPYLYEETH